MTDVAADLPLMPRSDPPAVPPPPAPDEIKQRSFLAWLLPVLAITIALAAILLWQSYSRWHGWTTTGRPKQIERPDLWLVRPIALMGFIAAALLVPAIALLNRLRGDKRFCKWYFRISISLLKRVLLLMQIAGMATALYAIGAYFIAIKIVG